jgi:hypothetical protein
MSDNAAATPLRAILFFVFFAEAPTALLAHRSIVGTAEIESMFRRNHHARCAVGFGLRTRRFK